LGTAEEPPTAASGVVTQRATGAYSTIFYWTFDPRRVARGRIAWEWRSVEAVEFEIDRARNRGLTAERSRLRRARCGRGVHGQICGLHAAVGRRLGGGGRFPGAIGLVARSKGSGGLTGQFGPWIEDIVIVVEKAPTVPRRLNAAPGPGRGTRARRRGFERVSAG
jgi:hypothetical protein